MKLSRKTLIGLLVTAALITGLSAYAQVKRPYRNASVWNLALIRIKPGMNTAYLNYLATTWKSNQEAAKKEGLILSYKVLATESHSESDWNIILMTEYKDLATMEANQDKADALAQKVVGDDQKQMEGYKDRAAIREVLGDRIAREITLEPKP
jgi:hypothetical protein